VSPSQRLIDTLRDRGLLSSQALQRALGVSRATLARLYAAAGDSVVRAGRTRAITYAATRYVDSVGRSAPLFLVGEDGEPEFRGTLHLLHGRGALVEWSTGQVTAHADVPWFLESARPQGFLGRLLARIYQDELSLPPLGNWTADHRVRALALRGEDTPGAILMGEVSFRRFHLHCEAPVAAGRCIEADQRTARYAVMASAALAGEAPGSSAGGEQPKFTAYVRDAAGVRAVIVKFTPQALDHPAGRRWADLLACEHLALRLLRERGLPSAESELVRGDDRVFLEVTRFDRVGLAGRRSVVSLVAAAVAWLGGGTWSEAARGLAREKRLPAADALRILQLEAFARLIQNTDRHLGNLSLFWTPGTDTLTLAPCYDMLPMAFAARDGLVVERPLDRVLPDASALPVWSEMRDLARRYWQLVRESAAEGLVSADFLATCVAPAQKAMGG
jgi:hypothetical protein